MRRTARVLRDSRRGAAVVATSLRLEDWVQAGLPELRSVGVIS